MLSAGIVATTIIAYLPNMTFAALTSATFLADGRAALLGTIANPDVAFILLLIGIYAVLLEFAHPGTFVSAIVGVICLFLAGIALSALPVQYGALALLLAGIALMVAEAFTPGFGVLGLFGFAAFIGGAHFLFDTSEAPLEMRVSLPLIVGSAVASAALTFLVVGAAIKARQRPPTTGAEEMLASQGTVIDWSGETGKIRIRGEVWTARASAPLKPGDMVRVASRDGLTLTVEPI